MKGATAVASGTEINFHIHIQPLRLYTTRQRVVDVIAHATGPLPPWKHNIPSPRRWEQGRWQQRAAGETGRGRFTSGFAHFQDEHFFVHVIVLICGLV